jgi:hypothetical protein
MRPGIAAIIVSLALGASLHADGPVQMSIHDGRVWLVAREATVSEILAEWARVGRTTITNADRVPGGRLTLDLAGVPERQALDLLLRAASGFVATTRTAVLDSSAQSEFERIVIVGVSHAPVGPVPTAAVAVAAPPPVAAAAVPIAPGVRRLVDANGRPLPDDQEDAPTRATQPPPASMPPGFSAPPQTAPNPAAPPDSTSPAPPQTAPGVPVPGMIVPATPHGQPRRPPR